VLRREMSKHSILSASGRLSQGKQRLRFGCALISAQASGHKDGAGGHCRALRLLGDERQVAKPERSLGAVLDVLVGHEEHNLVDRILVQTLGERSEERGLLEILEPN